MSSPPAAAADILTVPILHQDTIHCGFHLEAHIVETVLSALPSSAYAIVTDTNVGPLFLPSLAAAFEAAIAERGVSSRVLTYQVAPGEEAKSRAVKAELEDWLLEERCTRDTVILALGGGVIGDLTGFVAATFMRGVKFCQIPTTLLAMVDSAVGGKTAIDTAHGKNLIGAFWQPSFIFIDLAFLETLPAREFSNGMAEVVKTAAIWDEVDFAKLESRAPEIISAVSSGSTRATAAGRTKATRTEAQELLLSVVSGSINVKAHIVTIDERETGLRNLVNFGHTIGHAIEAVLTPKMLHGECVAVGIVLEAEVARQLGVLSQVAVGRLKRALKAYGLPIALTDPRIATLPEAKGLTVDRLLDIMRIDKKNAGAEKKVVLLNRIGSTHEPKASIVHDDVIRKTLSDMVKVEAGIPRVNPVTMSTPGSKSISNRALVLAALAKGTCRLRNLLHSDDTAVMMSSLIDLQGAQFSWEDGGETLVVEGGAGHLKSPPAGKELYIGNAGTAARFLTSVCALVRSGSDEKTTTVLTGNSYMKVRPIAPLVTALTANGTAISYVEGEGCLPLAITSDGFRGGRIQLAASISSQYVSSILLCAPYAAEPVVLELTGGQVISQPYIDMTLAMMKTFGIEATRDVGADGQPLNVYRIPQGCYVNPARYNVESDASSATYPLAIAAMTGTTCTVENIGSSSLQGDAGFAKNILEPMGCTVVQTETETTVTGPPAGQLKSLGEVDMETMTDAFLTASVLAAVAAGPATAKDNVPNVTRIFGIANQRVKECNRIKGMRDQLKKFGVETDEFDDGIIIFGTTIDKLKRGVSVHCYDDHRVAMAFSVLAIACPETVIEERRCVEKTWPNWWDDLENKIGIKVQGVDHSQTAPSTSAAAAGVSASSHDPNASVFLIGMRGAGKTWVGEVAARALGFDLIDADVFLSEQIGQDLAAFVAEKGWPAFRVEETRCLKILMEKHAQGHVISLGGGVVETAEGRELLKKYGQTQGPVVYVVRPVEEIMAFLEVAGRPPYGESNMDVYTRRAPWYAECSSFQFFNHTQLQHRPTPTAYPSVNTQTDRSEVARYFRFITGRDLNRPASLLPPRRSTFLSLTFPELTPALPFMDEISAGVDAIELRVDLLSEDHQPVTAPRVPSAEYVSLQLAGLRQHTSLPVVFAVRTHAQGGMFPDGEADAYFALLDLAVRLGCEYIDLEVGFPEDKLAAFAARKGRSHVIASWHNWSGSMRWDGKEAKEKHALAAKYGDVAKLVGKASAIEDNFALRAFVGKATEGSDTPLLAINMGAAGQLSRVLNTVLSPVTHPNLPTRAAPGQLSFAEVQAALHLIGATPARQFHLFGSPVSQSLSPTLHNTAFKTLGLPHTYGIHETETVDDKLKALLAASDFGGANVTIPLKLDVLPLLDSVSDHAKAVGAVNTIVPEYAADGTTRTLRGENTDWLAIRDLCASKLPATVRLDERSTGLVIGAGGTCRAAVYALHQLGLKTILLFNRTRASADRIVAAFPQEFNIVVVDSLERFPDGVAPPSVIVGTIPGQATTTSAAAAAAESLVHLPAALLAHAQGGVVLDMAYKPFPTPLLALADGTDGWNAVPGLSALLVQAFYSFELWTGLQPPRMVCEKAVWAKYLA